MRYGILSRRTCASTYGKIRLLSLPLYVQSARSQAVAAYASAGTIAISGREIHVHWLRSDRLTEHEVQRYLQLLTPAEERYAAEASDANVMQQRILARSLVRATLSKYLPQTQPQQLSFGAGVHGKPYLIPQSAAPADRSLAAQLQFNLSHTATLLGCAVALNLQVGLDVELASRATRHKDVTKIAQRKFSHKELKQLEGVSDPVARQCLFMALWTLKESVVKARGTGISAPPGLKGFSVELQPSDGITLEQQLSHSSTAQSRQTERESAAVMKLQLSHCAADDSSTYSLMLCQPSARHYAALCVQQPPSAADASEHVMPVCRKFSDHILLEEQHQVMKVPVIAASQGWHADGDQGQMHSGKLGSGLRLRMFECNV